MLVLTRKPRQKILIGDGISITVLAIQGQQVRLGISAPAQVPILRGEVPREGARARGDRSAADSPPAPPPPLEKNGGPSGQELPAAVPVVTAGKGGQD